MANYYGHTRTNYFRVTDAGRLKQIIDSARSGEDTISLFQHPIVDEIYYGFGCHDSISGLCENWEQPNACNNTDELDDDEPSFDLFIEELSEILHPDDAIIITEIGYEKLRYLIAWSVVITRNDSFYIDLRSASLQKARDMLQNPGWNTAMEY